VLEKAPDFELVRLLYGTTLVLQDKRARPTIRGPWSMIPAVPGLGGTKPGPPDPGPSRRGGGRRPRRGRHRTVASKHSARPGRARSERNRGLTRRYLGLTTRLKPAWQTRDDKRRRTPRPSICRLPSVICRAGPHTTKKLGDQSPTVPQWWRSTSRSLAKSGLGAWGRVQSSKVD
jgi:hypothetical protein